MDSGNQDRHIISVELDFDHSVDGGHIMEIPKPRNNELPSEYADRLGQFYTQRTDNSTRRQFGQYMTPLPIARTMARQYRSTRKTVRLLDPGAGTGVLSCALCETLLNHKTTPDRLSITAFETDTFLATALRLVFEKLRHFADSQSCELVYNILTEDFILHHQNDLSSNHSLFTEPSKEQFDVVIANPPYFKIPKSDPRSKAAGMLVHGQPNIYALFMGVSAFLLRRKGKLVFITPRSFASGPYFRRFREIFFRIMQPEAVHSYVSRRTAFRRDRVLQENVIFCAVKEPDWQTTQTKTHLRLSASDGPENEDRNVARSVLVSSVLDFSSANIVLKIPTTDREQRILELTHEWGGSLEKYGLQVSTGPVVPFRATEFLRSTPGKQVVPLLWMHNVQPMKTNWPQQKNGKQQYIRHISDSRRLLIPLDTCILVRRFSAKEDKRRLIAAPVEPSDFAESLLGIENHLNYVRARKRSLTPELAWGIAAVLNSEFMNEYYRIVNGNTQVSATELREIPLPPLDAIEELGRTIRLQQHRNHRPHSQDPDPLERFTNDHFSEILVHGQA